MRWDVAWGTGRAAAAFIGIIACTGGIAGPAPGAPNESTPITTALVVDGLSRPVFVTTAPGDDRRLYILEQHGTDGQARIRIFDRLEQKLRPTPFLTVSVSTAGEQGLLGLAFHPNFVANGLFYVDYTDPAGDPTVVEYRVSDDPEIADANSAHPILTIDHPNGTVNHNGGWIGFGPDAYLYIAVGDGGGIGDPLNNALNRNRLLGKILRLDIDRDDFPNDTTRNYGIPADNPFVAGNGAAEIWAYGLRNPWRNSFDRGTGDFYIADVGQFAWEEINHQLASSTGGENYGWRCREGFESYNGCSGTSQMRDPIHAYAHGPECSITGGYVYRGTAICDLQGAYFFADYCSGAVWSLRYDPVNRVHDLQSHDLSPASGPSIDRIVSFGEGHDGELYVCDHDGEIFVIVPDGPSNPCTAVGDLDCDGSTGVADINPFVLALTDPEAYALAHPDCDRFAADCSKDGRITVSDVNCFVKLVTGQAP